MTSPTAQKTENPTTIQHAGSAERQATRLYKNRDEARKTKPICEVCECRIAADQVNERRCSPCRRGQRKVSKTDRLYERDPGMRLTYLPGFGPERMRRKISRMSLERMCGVSDETQMRIERGGQTRLYSAQRLADALGVSVEELGGEG